MAGGRRRAGARRRVNHDGDDFVNHMLAQEMGEEDEEGLFYGWMFDYLLI